MALAAPPMPSSTPTLASQTDPSYWVQALPDRIAVESIVKRLATNTRWLVLGNADMRKLKHEEVQADTSNWDWFRRCPQTMSIA